MPWIKIELLILVGSSNKTVQLEIKIIIILISLNETRDKGSGCDLHSVILAFAIYSVEETIIVEVMQSIRDHLKVDWPASCPVRSWNEQYSSKNTRFLKAWGFFSLLAYAHPFGNFLLHNNNNLLFLSGN